MTDKEAMAMALEALEMYGNRHRATYLLEGAWDEEITLGDKAITALKEALAQPEQEPVAYLVLFDGAGKLLEFTKGNYLHGAKVEHIPLYTHPPQRTWVGLTDEEANLLWENIDDTDSWELIKQVEAKLKEKNT